MRGPVNASSALQPFATLLLAACVGGVVEGDAPNPRPNNPGDFVRARLNGAQFEARAQGAQFIAERYWDPVVYVVSGATSATSSLSLRFTDALVPGVYPVGGREPRRVAATLVIAAGNFISAGNVQTGTVTITEVSSTRVRGTFAFTAPSRTTGRAPSA